MLKKKKNTTSKNGRTRKKEKIKKNKEIKEHIKALQRKALIL